MSALPAVPRRYAVSLIVPLSILAQACATVPQSAGPAGQAGVVLEPGTVWNFSATAIAANLYLNQRHEFSEPVTGELTILTPDSAAIVSTHGTCPGDTPRPARIVRSGSVNRIRCGRLYLELLAGGPDPGGTLSVMVDVEHTTRGACSNWQVDPKTGQRLACLAYDEQVRRRKERTAPVPVRLSAAGG